MSRSRRPALGRGLGALIPEKAPAPKATPGDEGLRHVGIERIHPDPEQPRKSFDEAALEGLARSIKRQGVIQPLVVTLMPGRAGHYRILAGERRWRAAQKAGLHEVPIVVRETAPEARLELSLVENLQREDLDPIEEALAYQALMERHDYTQEALAERVGKDRSTIANAVRLLRLPEKVREMIVEGQLGMGHARALLGLDDPDRILPLAKEVIARKLSVRAVEAAVRKMNEPARPKESSDERKRRKIIVDQLEQRLRAMLGVRAKLKPGRSPKGPGKLEIPYRDLDELDTILRHILDEGDS